MNKSTTETTASASPQSAPPPAIESTPYYHGKEAVGRKIAFACGEIVYNFPWMLVSSFLMFFLTDIALVPAAVVSALFLGVRVFDAVNDPIIGLMADRTRSKMGRYRPWLLGGGLALIPIVILLFWAHPEWSEGGRVLYACIFYCLAVVAATAWNIPYGGLNASITPDSTERTSFASYRIAFSSAACAIASGIFLPLANRFGLAQGNATGGYLGAAVVVCLIALPFVFVCVLGTKEVVHPPKDQKIRFKAVVQNVVKNPPLIILVIAFFIYGFLSYGRMTVAMYYFTYNWNNPNLFSLFTLFNGIITGAVAFFGAHLMKIFKSKRNTLLVGYAGMTIFSLVIFFLDPATTSPAVVLGLLYLSGAANGMITCMIYAMIPDSVEYGQWKSGVRADGFVYSGTSFMLKFGGAISPALLGVLMAATGYVPNVAQNTATLGLLNGMMALMPAGLSLLGFVIFLFYKLDDKMHAKIIQELKERGEHSVG